MIAFLLYHGLCKVYLTAGNTTDVLEQIQRISLYVSCAVYLCLALAAILCHVGDASIVILCIAVFEQIAMCMLPVHNASAAFHLVRIDMANKGLTVDDNGLKN